MAACRRFEELILPSLPLPATTIPVTCKEGSMSSSNLRHAAIHAVADTTYKLQRVNFKDTHIKDLFAINVFSEAVQRERLPNQMFKSLQRTIKQALPLEAGLADA